MKKKAKKLLRLDVACGNNKNKGWTGIDIIKKGTQADIEHNLLHFPWPLEDESVDEVNCSHFLEHIPHGTDGYNDPFFEFFNELWRIMKPGATALFVTPYYTSGRAYQDPTHQRFIAENTFIYFNKYWRSEMNKLDHYPITTDFEIVSINYALSPEHNGRSSEAIQHAVAHYWNTVMDMQVTIRKPKKGEKGKFNTHTSGGTTVA